MRHKDCYLSSFILLHDDDVVAIQKHFQIFISSLFPIKFNGNFSHRIWLLEWFKLLLQLLEMCTQAVAKEELLDSWRQLAFEVIVTLPESAPASVRKNGATLIPLVISIALNMMTDLENDEEWLIYWLICCTT